MKRRELLYTLGISSIGAVTAANVNASSISEQATTPADGNRPNNGIADENAGYQDHWPLTGALGSAVDVPFV